MPQPLLHLGDVGLVVERVGCSGCPQRVRADLEPQFVGVAAHQLVDAVGGDRVARVAFVDRPEKRAGVGRAAAVRLEVETKISGDLKVEGKLNVGLSCLVVATALSAAVLTASLP